jgi:uncharacterized protein YbjT (DUF2867 family)
MTTFVSGGTSSIGRVLVKELARTGVSLCVLVRRSSNRSRLELPGVEFIYGDVTDPQAVRKGMQGWQPHSFADGLAETWAEYQAQGWKA